MADLPHHDELKRSESEQRLVQARSGLADQMSVQVSRRPGLATLLVAFGLIALSYFVVLLLVRPETGLEAMVRGALNNAVSAVIVAGVMMALLRRYIVGAPLAIQLLAHGVLAPIATLLWYLAVIVGIGLRNGSLTEGFAVNPFPGGALSWQIFQGFFLYAAVAGASYSIEFAQAAKRASAALNQVQMSLEALERGAPPSARRIMVKHGGELQHVDVSDIIAVLARDEYVELITRHKAYLSRQSLTSVIEALPEGFKRVHRSRVINMDKVLSAEPAGDGRLTIHMEGGHAVATSRAGARVLREQAR